METYNGHVRTPTDAIILFEACRLGLLPRVQRRLSEKERQSIRSGSVFVWDEREAGMRRWTDGKSWSASRVSGSFLTYREMEGKRGGSNFVQPAPSRGAKTPDSGRNSADDPADGEEGPDGYRYKPDGLMKQSFSITTTAGQHLHLISYYSRSHPTATNMRQPSNDPTLASIQIPKGMYPESSVTDQTNTPAVTRSPMPGAPNYAMATAAAFARQPPPPPYPYYAGFIPHPAGYMYPISPMHTPPGYALHPYHHPAGLPPLGHPGSPFGPPPPPPLTHVPPTTYDQRPLRTSLTDARGPPSMQHSASNPAAQVAPQTYSPPTTANATHQAPVPLERSTSAPQIDPRLTGIQPQSQMQTHAQPQPQTQTATPPTYATTTTTTSISTSLPAPALASPRSPDKPSQPPEIPVTASQAPAIGALVHESGITPGIKTLSTVTTSEVNVTPRKDERSGSNSPGGNQQSVPPQDIPSEKLGFREDMRALSKLDRVFARV